MPEPDPDRPPSVDARLAGVIARLDAFERVHAQQRGALDQRLDRVMEVLQRVFDHEQDDRRRIAAARGSAGYSAAYEDPEPLVSVVIPTYSNVDGLMEISLPSVLAQDHLALEVIVVGDGAVPEIGAALARLGDPRVRYENLAIRGPYPEERVESWLATGTPPFNAGVRLARGRWIAPFSDDDRMKPEAVSSLLAHARRERLEFVYSKLHAVLPDGGEAFLEGFPPRVGHVGLQGSIYHAGLAFMELELAHALFRVPNDWGLIRRMWLAGVRIGFLDAVVADYYPSMRGVDEPTQDFRAVTGPFESPSAAGVRAEREWAQAEADAETRALRAELADLQRYFDAVVGSRRWRWSGPPSRAVASIRSAIRRRSR